MMIETFGSSTYLKESATVKYRDGALKLGFLRDFNLFLTFWTKLDFPSKIIVFMPYINRS